MGEKNQSEGDADCNVLKQLVKLQINKNVLLELEFLTYSGPLGHFVSRILEGG